jgi:hypothetical protein
MSVALVFIFYYSYEIRVEDDNGCNMFFFLALRKTMTSLPTPPCILKLYKKKKKNLEKDDEPSPSSSTTQEKKP